jgi:Uncharacterized protein conserved in bacteria
MTVPRNSMTRRTLIRLTAAAGAAALARTTMSNSEMREQTPPPPSPSSPQQTLTVPTPPPVLREFRGVWVATVANIDWPSKPGLPAAQQQAELLALLDRAKALHLNAIIFQVRPACDALYPSELEPWSEYLTGEQGRPPQPFYDPLAFAVEEAHKRGLELHTWFNPYRAKHPSMKGPVSEKHVSRARPELVRSYGTHLWMDPADPEVQAHSLRVVLDVVRRYDIDGVHVDDYFYPYKERDKDNKIIDFPDAETYQKYIAGGGTLARDDWRRASVNTFIESMYREVKALKPWVKVGISPFGIGRPGKPAQIKGFDQYAELYADAQLWWNEGWCDYYSPQLYWRIEQTAQAYPVLLAWWVSENQKGRHLWPGQFTSRATPDGPWPPEEIEYQIRATRGQAGASGTVHFSARALMDSAPDSLGPRLRATVYQEPALIPASPWLAPVASAVPPAAPLELRASGKMLTWRPGDTRKVWQWAVQVRAGDTWQTFLLPGDATSQTLPAGANAAGVYGLDRYGLPGASATIAIPAAAAVPSTPSPKR